MHFDAKTDTNGDHMISREDRNTARRWDMMKGKDDSIDCHEGLRQRRVNFSAREMDTDHDGSVSKAGFAIRPKFDGMKTGGMVSMDSDGRRGNTPAGLTPRPAVQVQRAATGAPTAAPRGARSLVMAHGRGSANTPGGRGPPLRVIQHSPISVRNGEP